MPKCRIVLLAGILGMSSGSASVWGQSSSPSSWEELNSASERAYEAGHYAEAEMFGLDALRLAEAFVAPDEHLATSLNNLAVLYRVMGKYTSAEQMGWKALTQDEKNLGEKQPSVARDLENLAEIDEDEAQYVEAEPLHHRAIAILQKVSKADDPALAIAGLNLARCHANRGSFLEAEPLYLQSLASLENVLGPE